MRLSNRGDSTPNLDLKDVPTIWDALPAVRKCISSERNMSTPITRAGIEVNIQLA